MSLILIVRRSDDGKSTWDGIWNGTLEVDLEVAHTQQYSLGNARVNLGSVPVLYNILTGSGSYSSESSLYTDGALSIKSGVAEGTTFERSFSDLYTDGTMPVYSAVYHFDITPIDSNPSLYSDTIIYNHGIDEKTDIGFSYSFSTTLSDTTMVREDSIAQDESGIVLQPDVYSFGALDRLPGFLGYAEIEYKAESFYNPENLEEVNVDGSDMSDGLNMAYVVKDIPNPNIVQLVDAESALNSDNYFEFSLSDTPNPENLQWVTRDTTDQDSDNDISTSLSDTPNPENLQWVVRDTTDQDSDNDFAPSFITLSNGFSYIQGEAELLPKVDALPITYIISTEGEETTITNGRSLISEAIIETTFSEEISKVLSLDQTYYDVTKTTTPTYKYEQNVDYTQRTHVEYVTYYAEDDPLRVTVTDNTIVLSSVLEYRFEIGTPVVETYTILAGDAYTNLINTMEQQSIELISTLESRAESI